MPSGGWASRSSTATLPEKPSERTTASATAMSLTGQNPPADPGPAWWNPPRRLSAGTRRRSVSLAPSTVPPVASRTVRITSSTGTSEGSTPKTPASVSGRESESSSSAVWTRARSAYETRRGTRHQAGATALLSRSHQAAKSARRGSTPVNSRPESGSR